MARTSQENLETMMIDFFSALRRFDAAEIAEGGDWL